MLSDLSLILAGLLLVTSDMNKKVLLSLWLLSFFFGWSQVEEQAMDSITEKMILLKLKENQNERSIPRKYKSILKMSFQKNSRN